MLRRSHFCKASLLIPIIQVRGIRRTQEGSSSRASDRTCELQQFLQFLQSLRSSSPHMGHMKNLCRARVERNMLFKKIFSPPRPQNKLNLCNQGPKGKKKKKGRGKKKQQATTTPIRWPELESFCVLGDNLYPQSEGIISRGS